MDKVALEKRVEELKQFAQQYSVQAEQAKNNQNMVLGALSEVQRLLQELVKVETTPEPLPPCSNDDELEELVA